MTPGARYRLDKRGGELFVRCEAEEYDRPVLRTLWWRVIRTSGWVPCWFEAEGGDSARGGSDLYYCRLCGQRIDALVHVPTQKPATVMDDPLALGSNADHDWWTGRLPNGATYRVLIDPRADATHISERELAKPRCRAEVRWHAGRWEKCLKKGWVAA